ncbi:Glycosyltransferase involved in cell wall bisynthesis [Belliella buryatensis]|uniref:Glycosyltransferase involved in cell wall bisynthesis n=1 Tax=Belliella buryatensis TaxID=1500549 RepID=A0A239H3E7_9BACT|nr:glycosyltransferase family 4 protein [Belliella buryatensis]SNS74784.1 Glycosyltransferase involved in cell wall bisynthesis [Belliella buryatensis]
MGASSRLRTFQYLPLWQAVGDEIAVHPFFNEAYLNAIYSKTTPNIFNVLFCYFRRVLVLFTASKYDHIIIEKELFPFLPAWAEYLLSKTANGYLVDYDDAVFHNYDRSPNAFVRSTMGNKIDHVIKRARVVLVGNKYLQERAERAGARQIVHLPTVIDSHRYNSVPKEENTLPIIGWIGSPTTLKYLKEILPTLEEVNKKSPFVLMVVNDNRTELTYSGQLELRAWSEETEVSSIQQMDIGIMPLEDSPWERGKCAYKLIQYMACGLPVVASPIGMNTEVVKHEENGFLATTDQEWIESLTKLLTNPHLRQSFGKAGHQLVQEKYTLEKNFEILKKVLTS